MENKFTYKKRVLYFGMPDMGIFCLKNLLSEGVNIVGVVAPPKDSPTYNMFCNIAKQLNMNLITYENSLKDADFLTKIKNLNADIAIVCSYSKLFPKELLDILPNKFVNTHPSMLPKYRGPNPYSHVIINNEPKTGVTLHIMDESFDTGAIIGYKDLEIDEKETMGTLFNKLNFVASELLIYFLRHFETTGEITTAPQPQGEYPKAVEINTQKGDNIIDWTKDAHYIERFIRALNPFIIARTFYKGAQLSIFSARAIDKEINAKPGLIVNTEKGLFVNTGKGILEIRVLQVAGFMVGEGKDFIKHFNIPKGDVFDNGNK